MKAACKAATAHPRPSLPKPDLGSQNARMLLQPRGCLSQLAPQGIPGITQACAGSGGLQNHLAHTLYAEVAPTQGHFFMMGGESCFVSFIEINTESNKIRRQRNIFH